MEMRVRGQAYPIATSREGPDAASIAPTGLGDLVRSCLPGLRCACPGL